MKYLKRFNESQHNYASYEDVQSIIEEAIYLLEVSFEYNVDVSYQFEDFTCIFTIKPIGWDINSDLDKRDLLVKDLVKVEKMFLPYMLGFVKLNYTKYDNLARLKVDFKLFCKKCENEKLGCLSCDGNKTIICGCDNGVEKCQYCNGDNDCEVCDGSGTQTCEWCNGNGSTSCSDCDGTGVDECDHDWL